MTLNLRQSVRLQLGLVASLSPLAFAPLPVHAAEPVEAEARTRGLDEIIVTAQRRSQNINEVGITIAAFDSDAIRDLGMQTAIDVASHTSNFSVNTLITNVPNFTIRGVGVNDYAINQATSVGVYVDDVFLSSPALLLFQMFDTERVEVLKGPQGTLYGRNTTGGAVVFVSKTPTDTPQGSAAVEIGNYGYYAIDAALSGPLGDGLSGRIAVNSTQSDGFQESLVTGNDHGGLDRVSARVILDWRPTDDLLLRLNLRTGRDKSSLNSLTTPGVGSSTTSGGTIDSIDGVPYRDSESTGASLIAEWQLPSVKLTSVTSYDHLDRFEFGDTDGLEIDGRIDQVLVSDIKQFTQELRVNSAGSGPLTWVAGLYYGEDEIDDSTVYQVTGAGFPPFVFGVQSPYAALDSLGNTYLQKSESRAVFGQAEWSFAERWTVTGGLRYTEETKELNDVTTPWVDEPGPGESGPVRRGLLFPPESFSEDFSAVSGKVGLDFRMNEDALLYASISKGFKSGGFQGTLVFSPANIIPFDEETVLAYEVGTKLTMADGRLQINGAAFFYDYENLQAQGTIPGGAGGVENLFALQNIGDAEVLGVELDIQAAPTDRLTFGLGVGYLDAEIVDPFIAEVQPGGRPAMSPTWDLNGQARFVFLENTSATWFVQGDFQYQGEVFFDIYETPFLRESSYTLYNAAIGVESAGKRWRATVWGRNLADTEYRVGGFTGGVAGPVQAFGAPRTYGVSFSYRFD